MGALNKKQQQVMCEVLIEAMVGSPVSFPGLLDGLVPTDWVVIHKVHQGQTKMVVWVQGIIHTIPVVTLVIDVNKEKKTLDFSIKKVTSDAN